MRKQRVRLGVGVCGLIGVALGLGWAPEAAAQGACASPANAIVAENCLPGAPRSEWDIAGAGSASIQGFSTDISVARGARVAFKIQTDARDYRLDIYRMGFYGGQGARRVATVQPQVALPQSQPACLRETETGLIDCGNWAVSASWDVPASATSGIYFAKLVREDGTLGSSHIVFVVRNDAGGSELLFQTSDTTWQAYNAYGGNSLYRGQPAGRAYKVSYNRPFTTRDDAIEDWVFNAEYPMVRWLEANGFDVSYTTGVDTERRGQELLEHRVFLSVGHDEYWSPGQRANVEAARNAGVHLAFFSGNEVFWRTRWEPGRDAGATPHRTLVSYKDTHANTKLDPLPGSWTGTWRDGRAFNPTGAQPENALTGTLFTVNCCSYSIQVPAAEGRLRLWRNTSIANLAPGQVATLSGDTLGYEWDEDVDNGFRPPGLIRLSHTEVDVPERILDNGSNYGPGRAVHSLTLYKHPSGALVFGAGTVQWSWGLDANHDRPWGSVDVRIQQATINLFADMGVQPTTLQPGLIRASPSTDTQGPVVSISTLPQSAPPAGTAITVNGTASDLGGRVAGVEYSVDGGVSWRRAPGREVWSFSWTPEAPAGLSVLVRGVDDSANQGPAQTYSVQPGGEVPPDDGPGGPVLVLAANPFGRYYAEILRAEGLNLFRVAAFSALSRSLLDAHDVVVLGEGTLTSAQVNTLSGWVNDGGQLIAMRPGPELVGLLGLGSPGGVLADAYLRVDTSAPPGAGIVGETMQFHGQARRYTLAGATALATLYDTATLPTALPALSLRNVGSRGGRAAAFAYDLARSIVYTRQGNPAWSGQERDGVPPIRPDDLFYGAAAFDPRPDWVDLTKVGIPQADEQQRLLINLILHLNRDKKPLPRFWYFPRNERAVVVMTGDDHAFGNFVGRWDQYRAASAPGCSVQDWECVRASAYVFSNTPIDEGLARAFEADGFELGLHVTTDCLDVTPAEYGSRIASQLATFQARFPSIRKPTTNRTHCIAFPDWSTVPRLERLHGIRLDTNYYYWPPTWVRNAPGLFTGSGIPMRFADLDGSVIDVYQAATQMTDESGQDFPFTANALLERALGPQGFYGAFTANMHTDEVVSLGSDLIIASAQSLGVPVVSSRQLLDWLDGRNASSYQQVSWSGSALSFQISAASGARGLYSLLPSASVAGGLSSLQRNGTPVTYTLEVIKGVEYAVFPSPSGTYVATYAQTPPDPPAQVLVDTTLSDFGAGIASAGVSVVPVGNGAVQFTTGSTQDFTGGALPPGWSAFSWGSGGQVTFGGGLAQVNGARLGEELTGGPGRTLEVRATFGGAPFQHVGLGQSLSDGSWILFSTGGTSNQLFARINNNGSNIELPLPPGLVGTPHDFRIDWGPSSITFLVDGAVVASQAITMGGPLRAVASDFAAGGPGITVDWVRTSAHSATGTFVSRVHDAGATVTWGALRWTATTPIGASVALEVRTGGSPVPDASWSPFTVLSGSGALVGRSARFAQYRASFSSSGAQGPVLEEVRLETSGEGGQPPVDTTPPSTPSNLVATAPGPNRVDLTWGASTDNVGVTGYLVFRGGVQVGTTTATSFSDTGVLPSTTYGYAVRARDAAGNVSQPSGTATITTPATPPPVDTTPPSAPSNLAATAPGPNRVDLTWGASTDNVGVTGYLVFRAGVQVGTTTATTFSDTGVLPSTTYGYAIRARDAAGNVSQPSATATITTPAPPAARGPVLALSFEEASGSIALDRSGNGHDGTLSGPTRTPAGRHGAGLAFDGVNDWVTVADAPPLDLTTGMTLMAWVRPASWSGWTTVMLKERPSGLAWALYASDDTGRPPAVYANVGFDQGSTGVVLLPLETWSHLAGTYDGATLRLWVNGVQVASRAVSGAMSTSTGALRLGGNAFWGEYFQGVMDEVRIYDRALSPAELQADMNNPILDARAGASLSTLPPEEPAIGPSGRAD